MSLNLGGLATLSSITLSRPGGDDGETLATLKDACGASDDEDMPTFCARIVFELRELRTRMAERERQEPVAWAWDDALGCMHAHCGSRRPVWVDGECSDAKRAETSLRPLYAAPPIPRVEQEPVLFADHDTEIARLRAEVDYLRELLREARDSVNEELNHAEINRRQESIDYSRDLLAKIDAAIVKEN